MIDIHCHILPGLDDGARTIDDAVAMARLAVDDGIGTVIATPHHWEETYEATPQEIRRVVGQLRDRLAEEQIPLKLLPGQEVMMAPDLHSRLGSGDLVTLADTGDYLLVELPKADVPQNAEQVILKTMALGVTPIIAHPEKCAGIRSEPEVLKRLVQHGCLVQIDADSLGGGRLSAVARFACQLLRDGLVHILASDGHSPTARPPVIGPYLTKAAALTSPRAVEDMTEDRPNLIAGVPRVIIRAGAGR